MTLKALHDKLNELCALFDVHETKTPPDGELTEIRVGMLDAFIEAQAFIDAYDNGVRGAVRVQYGSEPKHGYYIHCLEDFVHDILGLLI